MVSALLVLHNGWGPKTYLGDPSGNTQGASTLAVSPASTSVVINKLSSFLLCCALWTTVCSIVVVVVRFYTIRDSRIENVGKYQSCMVCKLRILWKQSDQEDADQCVELLAGSGIDCETGFLSAKTLGKALSDSDPKSYAPKLEYCERLVPGDYGDGGSWVAELPSACAVWPSCRDACCTDLDSDTNSNHLDHADGQGQYRSWGCERALADGEKVCGYRVAACASGAALVCETQCCDETSFSPNDSDQEYYTEASAPTLAAEPMCADGTRRALGQHKHELWGPGCGEHSTRRQLGHVVGTKAWPEDHVFPRYAALLNYPGSNASLLAAAGWDGNSSTYDGALKGKGSRSFSHEMWLVCVVGRQGLVDHENKPKAKAVQGWNALGNNILAAASCTGIQGCKYLPEPAANEAGGTVPQQPDKQNAGPLVALFVGILANAAAHLAWWVVTTSDGYLKAETRNLVMKTWLSQTCAGNQVMRAYKMLVNLSHAWFLTYG